MGAAGDPAVDSWVTEGETRVVVGSAGTFTLVAVGEVAGGEVVWLAAESFRVLEGGTMI